MAFLRLTKEEVIMRMSQRPRLDVSGKVAAKERIHW
jgi:hypothetical protein